MEDGQIVFALIGMVIGGVVGGLIGKNRKIGSGWGAVLGVFLGWIGWIIAACSSKTNKPNFDDMSK